MRRLLTTYSLFCLASAALLPLRGRTETMPPFHSSFEATEGHDAGLPVVGWEVLQGEALVTDTKAAHGEQSVELPASDPAPSLQKNFASFTGGEVTFADLFLLPAAGLDDEASLLDLGGLRFRFGASNGTEWSVEISDDSGAWTDTGVAFKLSSEEVEQQWVRITARLDFASLAADVFINGKIVAYDHPWVVGDLPAYFEFLSLRGHSTQPSYLDDVYVGGDNPLFDNISRDGLPDSFKTEHGLPLDRSAREMLISGVPAIEKYFEEENDLGEVNSDLPGEPVALPFAETFESRLEGQLHNQGGWRVTEPAKAQVQSTHAWKGDHALKLTAAAVPFTVDHAFEPSGATVVWTDLVVRPARRDISRHPVIPEGVSVALYLDRDGDLVVFDGNASAWRTVGLPPASLDGGWRRLTVRKDYQAAEWMVWVDSVRVAKGVGFATTTSSDLSRLSIHHGGARSGYVDDIGITLAEPAALDNDGDGLTNYEEYLLGTDPENADTSGDGMADGDKVARDLDPLVWHDLARVPSAGEGSVAIGFEVDEGFTLGALDGQVGWEGHGAAQVTDVVSAAGANSVELAGIAAGEQAPDSARRLFLSKNERDESPIWLTFYGKLQPGDLPSPGRLETGATVFALDRDGLLHGFDGIRYRWTASGLSFTADDWVRFDVMMNFERQSWDLCVDQVLVLRDLGFMNPSPFFLAFEATGARNGAGSSFLDSLSVGRVEPENLDFSGDGMTNAEKRALGLDVYLTDTTGDGLPDWWLVQHGLDALDASIGSEDPDGDGLTNRREFTVGTDPTNADTDSDGWNDLKEQLAGSDPVDPGNHPSAGALAPWASTDIGARQAGGAFGVEDEYRLAANARDLTGTADGFHFLYQEVTGDFDFSARVDALKNVFPDDGRISWTARAGLMARESLEASSRFVTMSLTPRGGFYFRGRQHLDEVKSFDIRGNWSTPFPSWIKLKRRGNLFSGYRSYDGRNWVIVGSWTMHLAETLQLGMMTSSGHLDQFARSRFADVELREGGDEPGYWEGLGLYDTGNEIAALGGSSFTDSTGNWMRTGDSVYSREVQGSLDYQFSLGEAGAYILEIAGRQYNPHSNIEDFPLVVYVNGQEAGRPILVAESGQQGAVRLFLPHLAAGEHEIRIAWRNGRPDTFLQVDRVRLLSLGGEDSDENGLADWFDARLAEMAGLDESPVVTFISPLPLEGRSHYLKMLQIKVESPAGGTELVAPQPSLRGAYYADIPLDATGVTQVTVSEQGGAAVFSKEIEWSPFNILTAGEEEYTIRRGESMRFTATNANLKAADPRHPITIEIAPLDDPSDVDLFSSRADEPVILEFPEDGDYIIAGQGGDEDDTDNSGFVVIRVRGIGFGTSPAAVIGHVRKWDIPQVPEEAILEWDDHLFLNELHSGESARRFDLSVRSDRDGIVIGRLGDDGPILGHVVVQAIRDDSHAYTTSLKVIDRFSDGSFLVEGIISLGDIPSDLEIHLTIFRAGVLFEDGTTEQVITADDFDEFGRYRYRMIQSPETFGAACHTIFYYQDGEQISFR